MTMIKQIKAAAKHRSPGLALGRAPELSLDNSSALRSVRYNKKTRILSVEFRHGGKYEYYDVSKDEFFNLMVDESAGKNFVQEIRNNYEFKRIR